jgi:hypothetical protein
MSAQLVIALVLAVPVVAVLFSLGRAAWRMLVRNEEPEPGGSYGRQIVGRSQD